MRVDRASIDYTQQTAARIPAFIRPAVEAMVVGLLIGLVDAFTTNTGDATLIAYLLAGIALGVRHAGRAWSCWPPLGLSLYLVHVAAIACGRRPPYVESDFDAARVTLQFCVPAGLGLGFGTIVRRLLVAFGLFDRTKGPAVRILPRSAKGWLIAVALVGVSLAWLRWVFVDSSTIYSERYDEAKFHTVREGMTASEVEALLGPPIYEGKVYESSSERLWAYSRGTSGTSNYWRRWIFVNDGKVESVVADFWWD